MQFLLLAYDGTDFKALERRMTARPAHIEYAEKAKAQGQLHFATAILDPSDKMVGSMMVFEFGSRNELDNWLKQEPYVTGDVWREIEIKPCKVGPSFSKAQSCC